MRAYSVLSDEKKNVQIMTALAMLPLMGPEPEDSAVLTVLVLAVFEDIFETFMGGSFGRSRQRRNGPVRGSDPRYDLEISFERSSFRYRKRDFHIKASELYYM